MSNSYRTPTRKNQQKRLLYLYMQLFLFVLVIANSLSKRTSHAKTESLDNKNETLSQASQDLIFRSEKSGKRVSKDDLNFQNERHTPDSTHFQDSFQLQREKESQRLFLSDCHPCQCRLTKTGSLYANCYGRKLSHFPKMLPKGIHFLNLSTNRLQSLNTTEIFVYPSLKQIDLSHNIITSVSGNPHFNNFSNVHEITLYHNKINIIENGSFSGFAFLRKLDLSLNCIRNVYNKTFQGLTSLNVLDLSSNEILHIHDDAFLNLSNVHSLYLNNNTNLGYMKNFSPRLVRNLNNLQVLHLEGSSKGNAYPNEALGQLVGLSSLNIDLSKTGFGSPMKTLTRFTVLNFGPLAQCHCKNLSASYFQNVPHIRSLTFAGCKFHYIDPKAFSFLPRLESYTLYHITSYDLDFAFDSLIGFAGSSLKTLRFIHLYHSTSACRTLSKRHGRYLQNTSIEVLDLSSNRLSMFEDTFINAIPATLKMLVLSDNKFEIEGNLWNRLKNLPNLEELDIQNQNVGAFRERHRSFFSHLADEPEAPQMQDTHIITGAIPMDTFLANDFTQLQKSPDSGLGEQEIHTPANISSDGHRDKDGRTVNASKRIKYTEFPIPLNLKRVKAARYAFFGGVLLSHRNLGDDIVLRDIDFSSSLLTDWTGLRLPFSIKFANLSFNMCTKLNPLFFLLSKNLKRVDMQGNYLGPVLSEDYNGKIFDNLNKLTHLDLSRNIIFQLPHQIFKGLASLKVLTLRENKIKIFNFSISHMTNLKCMDLSKNSIFMISHEVMIELDRIVQNRSLTLDLSDNPLPCTCDGLNIIRWMANTKVTLLRPTSLSCIDGTGVKGDIGDLKAMVKKLEKTCTNIRTLIISIVTMVTIITVSVIFAILRSNKWKLIYFKNKLLVKLYGYKPKRDIHSKFKYDAYVVYSELDSDFVFDVLLSEMEIKRQHRLCVEDRNFLPGTFIYNSITCAVQNSAHTILIISPDTDLHGDFLYASQMAMLEDYHNKGKDRACQILFLGDSSSRQIPKELLLLMKEERYLEFPPSDSHPTPGMQKEFWDRLSRAIGHYGEIRTEARTPMLIPD